jgi:hypothetical protein
MCHVVPGSVHHYCEVNAVWNIVNKVAFRATNPFSAIVVAGHTHSTQLIPQFRLPIFNLFTISVISGYFASLFEKLHKSSNTIRPACVARWTEDQPFPSQGYCFIKNFRSSVLLKLG